MPAFTTPQEAAAYTMLKQVLQNHVTLHRMSLLAAVMAGVGLLGDRCMACCGVETVLSAVAAQTLSRLKRRVRAQQTTPGFAPFVAESAQDPAAYLGAHARHLYDALRQLLHETSDAERLDRRGSMRVVLGLMADVLSMFLHQFDRTIAEVDVIIDEVVGPSLESYLKTNLPQTGEPPREERRMQPQRYGPFHYVPINRRPKLTWPNGARVALWVIPNIETFPLNEPVPGGTGKAPDIINWAPRDYGNRVGIFRIMDVLARHGVRGTVALNSEVCDDYPEIVEDAVKLGWEFMGHNQSNARYLHLMSPEEERHVVLGTFERIARATGTRPKGWLSSGLQESWQTLDYLVEAGASYVADWVNDDQPYVMHVGGKQLCSIPYSTEINDLPQIIRAGRSSEEFELMIRRQFDTLYREGARSGRVMAICLHPFVIGVPHRIGALDSALAYILRHEGVWRATGSEIIEHYLASGATF